MNESTELVRRAEAIDVAYLVDRLTCGGNTSRHRMVDDVHVFVVPGIPAFNLVLGLTERTLVHLDAILDAYHATATPCRIEMVPTNLSPTVETTLGARGLRPVRPMSILCAPADEKALTVEPDDEIDIRIVTTMESFEEFLQVQMRGFEIPEEWWDDSDSRHWFDRAGWTLFTAFIDERPAGSAILFRLEDLAYLVSGATDPIWRGRGVHRALINARIAVARTMGCETVLSLAIDGSVSQRNMLRAGLRIVCTKPVWSPGDPE